MTKRWFFILTLVLTGCGPFHEVDVDPTKLQNVHTIALAGPDDPDRYLIDDTEQILGEMLGAGVAGAAAGPIAQNAAIGATGAAKAGLTSLDIEASKEHFRFGHAITDALADELTKKGYKVIKFNPPRTHFVQTGFVSDYSGAPHASDLIMDCTITQAWYSDGTTKAFVPLVVLWMRLLDKNGSIIMVRRYRYYGLNPGENKREDNDITPDVTYNYLSHDDLNKSPARAIEAFRVGAQQLAQAVAASMK